MRVSNIIEWYKKMKTKIMITLSLTSSVNIVARKSYSSEMRRN